MNTDTSKYRKLGLLPYQAAFAANTARFKIGLWARQTGKDHTTTAEAVLDCFRNPGTTWIIVAAGERQALESLAKAKEWAAVIKFKIDEYLQSPANLPLAVARAASTTEIKWSNGSRLIALPANPGTIRGYSANLILTEFAFHENPDTLWRAIYPTISNPLRGGPKKLRIISTPNGLNNKFAQLWHSTLGVPPLGAPASTPIHPSHPSHNSSSPSNPPPSPNPALYLKSRITIHDAIAAGLGGPCGEHLDPAELQAALNDPEAWAQEYLCEFMDNSTVLLPYDLIETCESPLATELSSLDSLSASALPGNGRPQLFAGLDFARKNHLTVCWILEKIPAHVAQTITLPVSPIPNAKSSIPNAQWNPSPSAPSAVNPSNLQSTIFNNQFPSPSVLSVHPSSVPSVSLPSSLFLTREVLCLRNASTPEQLELLRPRLQLCQRIALDYTGPGIGLGDFLHREFGGGGASVGRASVPASRPGPAGKIELCPFTAPFKAELFPRLAAAFESRQLLIPIARDIREDLHSLYRTVTNSGNILYRAHATPDGHADRTTALALALRAAQTAPLSHGGATNVGGGFRSRSRRASYPSAPRTIAIIH